MLLYTDMLFPRMVNGTSDGVYVSLPQKTLVKSSYNLMKTEKARKTMPKSIYGCCLRLL